MSKHNVLYSVVCYIGGLESRVTKTLYQTTKLSDAERYLYKYIDSNPNCSKIYIESSYNTKFDKRRFDDED